MGDSIICVTFLLRGGALTALELRGVTVSSSGGSGYLGISIWKSKTYQEEHGVFRRLNITHQCFFPVTRMQNWSGGMKCQPKEPKVFGADILGSVTRLTKWIVADRGLPSDRFAIHSLRAVGTTCLYRPGVDLEYIRRFGRWQ